MTIKLIKNKKTLLIRTVRTANATNGSGGGGGALIYQEGGTHQGPVIFNNWDALYARLQAMRSASNDGGLYTVAIDNRFASGVDGGCNVPANAIPYNYSGVELTSHDEINGGDSVLNFLDGSHAVNLRHFSNFLTVNNLNAAAPLEVLPAINEWHLIRVHGGATIQTVNGGAAFWDCSNMTGGGIIAKVFDRSYIAGVRNGVIFDAIPAGVVLIGQSHSSNPNYPPFGRSNAITADAGSFVQIQMDNPTLHPKLPGFAGTKLAPQINTAAFTLPNPWLSAPSAVPVLAKIGDFIRLDASGGPISQTLPDLTTIADAIPAGVFVSVVETGGGIVTLVAAAGDTINGGPSVVLPANGGMLLQSDGLGGWWIIGSHS